MSQCGWHGQLECSEAIEVTGQVTTILTNIYPTDDFEARSPDELSLLKGERIELIERDDDFGDGWYLGKHLQNGKTGLFPEGEQTPSNKKSEQS